MSITKISCPNCDFFKEFPLDKLPQTTSKITCPKCKHVFTYTPPNEINDFTFDSDPTIAAIDSPPEPQVVIKHYPPSNSDIKNNETNYNLFDWYIKAIKKYAVLTGRARRKEYWYFLLVSMIIIIALTIIESILDKGEILSSIYNLAIFIPSLAVGIRRMHDTDRSGWWMLLPIVNIVFLAQEGQQVTNKYGLNPKGAQY